jgi:hypothetical protein
MIDCIDIRSMLQFWWLQQRWPVLLMVGNMNWPVLSADCTISTMKWYFEATQDSSFTIHAGLKQAANPNSKRWKHLLRTVLRKPE